MELQDRERFYHPPTPIHLRKTRRETGTGRSCTEPSWPIPWPSATKTDHRAFAIPFVCSPGGSPTSFSGSSPPISTCSGSTLRARSFSSVPTSSDATSFSRLLYGSRVSLSVGLFGILITYTLGLMIGGIAGYYGGPGGQSAHAHLRDPHVHPRPLSHSCSPGRLSRRDPVRSSLSHDHPDPLPGVVGLPGPYHPGHGPEPPGERVRDRGRGHGHVLVPHHHPAHPSQHRILRHRGRHPQRSRVHPGRGGPLLPGGGNPGAGGFLGKTCSSRPRASGCWCPFPWMLVPGVFIFLTVLAFNFLGDGLRDALDPKRVEGKA